MRRKPSVVRRGLPLWADVRVRDLRTPVGVVSRHFKAVRVEFEMNTASTRWTGGPVAQRAELAKGSEARASGVGQHTNE